MEKQPAEISLGYYAGSLDALLAGLEGPAFEGAVLELHGAEPRELVDLVAGLTPSRPELSELNRRSRRGTLNVGPVTFGQVTGLHLPIEGDNVGKLRALLERHADPAIANELRVYDARRYLVEAPDIGDNEIWVSSRLAEAAVEELRAALGNDLRVERGP